MTKIKFNDSFSYEEADDDVAAFLKFILDTKKEDLGDYYTRTYIRTPKDNFPELTEFASNIKDLSSSNIKTLNAEYLSINSKQRAFLVKCALEHRIAKNWLKLLEMMHDKTLAVHSVDAPQQPTFQEVLNRGYNGGSGYNWLLQELFDLKTSNTNAVAKFKNKIVKTEQNFELLVTNVEMYGENALASDNNQASQTNPLTAPVAVPAPVKTTTVPVVPNMVNQAPTPSVVVEAELKTGLPFNITTLKTAIEGALEKHILSIIPSPKLKKSYKVEPHQTEKNKLVITDGPGDKEANISATLHEDNMGVTFAFDPHASNCNAFKHIASGLQDLTYTVEECPIDDNGIEQLKKLLKENPGLKVAPAVVSAFELELQNNTILQGQWPNLIVELKARLPQSSNEVPSIIQPYAAEIRQRVVSIPTPNQVRNEEGPIKSILNTGQYKKPNSGETEVKFKSADGTIYQRGETNGDVQNIEPVESIGFEKYRSPVNETQYSVEMKTLISQSERLFTRLTLTYDGLNKSEQATNKAKFDEIFSRLKEINEFTEQNTTNLTGQAVNDQLEKLFSANTEYERLTEHLNPNVSQNNKPNKKY